MLFITSHAKPWAMGLSIWQILIIVLIVLLLFSARRLPELGRSLGEALNNFKKGLNKSEEDSKEDKDNSEK